MNPILISAIGTPLTEDQELHRDGLAGHLEDQWKHGIDGVLVAGTMGLMQLLTESVFRDVVRFTAEQTRGRGEVMAGAGDMSLARTGERIAFLNTQRIDGVAIPVLHQFQPA